MVTLPYIFCFFFLLIVDKKVSVRDICMNFSDVTKEENKFVHKGAALKAFPARRGA